MTDKTDDDGAVVPFRRRRVPGHGSAVAPIAAEDVVSGMLDTGMTDAEIVDDLARQGVIVSDVAVAALRQRSAGRSVAVAALPEVRTDGEAQGERDERRTQDGGAGRDQDDG